MSDSESIGAEAMEDSDQQWQDLTSMLTAMARKMDRKEQKTDMQAQSVAETLDGLQEGLQAVTREARRFTTEQCERLQDDLEQQLVE